MIILNYGTELLGINCKEKLGSTSVKILNQNGFNQSLENPKDYPNKKYVIIVRDVRKRWKSGYIQDMIGAFIGQDDIWKHHHVRNPNDEFWKILENEELDNFNVKSDFWKGNPNILLHGLDTMTKIHQLDKNHDWMYKGGHSKFYIWNESGNHLSEFLSYENVYFLDLKNLSSSGFSNWLSRNDASFNYTTFEHSNMKRKFLEKNIDLFWNEYISGHIKNYYRSDDISKLVSPFYDCKENKVFEPYYELCNGTQATLDYIRKHHERYIKC